MRGREIYMEHDGGTKFYRVLSMTKTGKDKGFVILNYGRIGTIGRTKVLPSVGAHMADGIALSQAAKKTPRGYIVKSDNIYTDLESEISNRLATLKTASSEFEGVLVYFETTLDTDAVNTDVATEKLTPAQLRKKQQAEKIAALPDGWGDW